MFFFYYVLIILLFLMIIYSNVFNSMCPLTLMSRISAKPCYAGAKRRGRIKSQSWSSQREAVLPCWSTRGAVGSISILPPLQCSDGADNQMLRPVWVYTCLAGVPSHPWPPPGSLWLSALVFLPCYSTALIGWADSQATEAIWSPPVIRTQVLQGHSQRQ